MEDLNNKAYLISVNDQQLEEITPKMDAIDWKRRKPTAEHLVIFGEYYRLLLTESWLKDIEYRFQLDRIRSITGLDEHEINVHVEIGGWLGLDRRLEGMAESEQEKFWTFLDSLDGSVNNDEAFEQAKQAASNRMKEIDDLNRMFDGS